MTAPTVVHSSKRNGYTVEVYVYTVKGHTWYCGRVENLTTGAVDENAGWSGYRTALEVAQQAADEAQI
jgi:hypothetical protein